MLDAGGIARAVVESVAENTSDAVVGTLVYGALFGPAGVAAYRAANTLDAMVGHRSPRYAKFGWAAARLDDALGWPAARAGAGLTVLCGRAPARTWRVLRRDGAAHPSPNAGRMEAAFAGALDLRLGGPLAYGGRAEQRPSLGDGRAPVAADIARANRLSSRVGAAALAASVAVWSLR
jgi:adenosylcobinamide-phosphate synthase